MLQNCDSLDFVEELDFLEKEDEGEDGETPTLENLPFMEYSTVLKTIIAGD